MKMLSLKRKDPKHKGCFQWLIANGDNMGRWTNLFGVNCLADLEDNKQFLKLQHEHHHGSVIEHHLLIQAEKR